MASGDTLCTFFPADNEPPSSNYATLDTRNGHPILAFDDTTAEGAVFTGIVPRNYAGGGFTVYVHWITASATSGTGGWTVEIEAMADGGTDLDSDSFDTADTITAATVPATSGVVKVTNVGMTHIDSVAAASAFRLRLKRDVANDSATGDLQLLALEIKES